MEARFKGGDEVTLVALQGHLQHLSGRRAVVVGPGPPGVDVCMVKVHGEKGEFEYLLVEWRYMKRTARR
jgi:hypothetical protein